MLDIIMNIIDPVCEALDNSLIINMGTYKIYSDSKKQRMIANSSETCWSTLESFLCFMVFSLFLFYADSLITVYWKILGFKSKK